MTVTVDDLRNLDAKLRCVDPLTVGEQATLLAAPTVLAASVPGLTLTPGTLAATPSLNAIVGPAASASFAEEVARWGRRLLDANATIAAGTDEAAIRVLTNSCFSPLPPLVRMHSPDEMPLGEALALLDSWDSTTGLASVMERCPGQLALMVAHLGSLATAVTYLSAMYDNNETYGLNSLLKPLAMPPDLANALTAAGVDPGPVADALHALMLGRVPFAQMDQGVALLTTDFTLTGWGTGASVTDVQPAIPTVNRFAVTVHCGSSPSAHPTVVLPMSVNDNALYTWDRIPMGFVNTECADLSQDLIAAKIDVDATNITITLLGTPVAGKDYTFKAIMLG